MGCRGLDRRLWIRQGRFESYFPSFWVAHSSRGLGHLPLKEEITGSNPVCASSNSLAGWEMPEMKPRRKAEQPALFQF